MGVMTSHRKRPEECMNVNHSTTTTTTPPPDSQRKRPRLLNSMSRPAPTPNGIVSRISRYPDAKPPLIREVHAPCRNRKFDLVRRDLAEPRTPARARATVDVKGSVLFAAYEEARRSALAEVRYLPSKGKEVIDVDAESSGRGVSDDSGVGEVVEVHDLEAKVVVDGGVVRRRQSTSSPDSALTNKGDNSLKVVVSGGKVWGSEIDFSSVQAYKKLIESADRRDDRLKRLEFEITLNEKRRETFNLLRPKKELVEVVPKEPFVPLTKEEENEVARAFYTNRKKILISHENSNIEISGEKFQCLGPAAWLNDEVINLYLELLKEREQREPQKYLKCHFFNTFFYKKLIGGRNGYDFKSVRRWTTQRKLGYGLLECDKIFVPIHREIHWCLAVINKKDKKFQYLDSLKGRDSHVLNVLAKYFVDEVKDKTGKDIDISDWEKEFVEDLPEQKNGYDCGVFMIKYADFYSRGLGLCFKQEHMPYFRVRTAKELLRLRAD
ncbi:ubiquitin-like-specific protease ESD4 [Lotus japonicus]|uniref:ubiquitin-like-specific protease ESD4 n=1 Tax=Lotus japonicus TaxID=34305 RepID=UPI0025893F4B|nr:ubiquitin-like-specific protease ESD4 [Lotus japonicus]